MLQIPVFCFIPYLLYLHAEVISLPFNVLAAVIVHF